MRRYSYVFSKSAARDFKKLDTTTKQRIAKKLQHYLKQTDPLAFARPLVDSALGSYRWRIGHYRIVFDVEGEKLILHDIKHRRDVYRR